MGKQAAMIDRIRADRMADDLIEIRGRVRQALGDRYNPVIAQYRELVQMRMGMDQTGPIEAAYAVRVDFKAEATDTRAEQVLTLAAGLDLFEAAIAAAEAVSHAAAFAKFIGIPHRDGH
jgi:hypothetical protein